MSRIFYMPLLWQRASGCHTGAKGAWTWEVAGLHRVTPPAVAVRWWEKPRGRWAGRGQGWGRGEGAAVRSSPAHNVTGDNPLFCRERDRRGSTHTHAAGDVKVELSLSHTHTPPDSAEQVYSSPLSSAQPAAGHETAPNPAPPAPSVIPPAPPDAALRAFWRPLQLRDGGREGESHRRDANDGESSELRHRGCARCETAWQIDNPGARSVSASLH